MKKSTQGIIALLLFILISTIGAIQLYPEYKAKQAVKAVLNDPDSAQFDDLFKNKKTGAVCGYVNAKNRMGGYVGKQLFIVSSTGEVDFDTSTTDEKLARMDSNEKFSNPILAKCYEQS